MPESCRVDRFVLIACGCLLVASGLAHVTIWLSHESLGLALTDAQQQWSGPLSMRKPILFGFSAGVTLLSIAWLTTVLRRRRRDGIMLVLMGVAMVAEVALITLQTWRGTPSHFNRSTLFDSMVLTWIEGLIVYVTFVIADLTWRSFQPLRADKAMAFAVRGGMSLLFLSCLIGFALVAYGNARVDAGMSPETYGTSGVVKFPHGVPMHAIQFLPLFAWSLARVRVPEMSRLTSVAFALTSLILFTLYSILQTLLGRSRFELTVASAPVLCCSMLAALAALGIGLKHYARVTATR